MSTTLDSMNPMEKMAALIPTLFRNYARLDEAERARADQLVATTWPVLGRPRTMAMLRHIAQSPQMPPPLRERVDFGAETADFVRIVGERRLSRLWASGTEITTSLALQWFLFAGIDRAAQMRLILGIFKEEPEVTPARPHVMPDDLGPDVTDAQRKSAAVDQMDADITGPKFDVMQIMMLHVAGAPRPVVDIAIDRVLTYMNINELVVCPHRRSQRVHNEGSWVCLEGFADADRDAIRAAITTALGPSARAIHLVEPGAGTGRFGGWLMDANSGDLNWRYHASDTRDTDCPSDMEPEFAAKPRVDVENLDGLELVKRATNRPDAPCVLVLVWPRPVAAGWLRAYKETCAVNKTPCVLLYVGEGRGGSTACDEFFDELKGEDWTRTFSMRGPRSWGTRDVVQVWSATEN